MVHRRERYGWLSLCWTLQRGIYLGDLTTIQGLALSFSGSKTEKIGFVSTLRFIAPSVILSKFVRDRCANQNTIIN